MGSTRKAIQLFALLGALAALTAAQAASAAAPRFALTYNSESASLPNDEAPHTIEVFCKKGTAVLGGGAFGFGGAPAEDVEVTSMVPTDLVPEPDSQPDDGWLGAVVNSSDEAAAMGVDAICARGVKPKYRSASIPLPVGAVVGKQALCPAKTQVVGGGVTTSGNDKDLEVVSSFPVDGPDKGKQVDDGWFGRAGNDSDADQEATVFAVCAKLAGLTYRQVSKPLPPESTSAQNFASVGCPAKSKVTGGGVDLTTGGFSSLDLEVAGSLPTDGPDKGTFANDGWTGTGHNDALTTGQMTVFAICKKPTPKKRKGA